ncbi:MAG: Gfo/Idh/MocA family oxidoreductase [Erysipelotrichales bacterium]|nr:Gfo/Idh/MocA family oxidoreductase [Erysipelotrichales bacterium]MBQ5541973.1 Gfo/Idh/MocA family oxidoreductase [Erysipelotrichales bacterium]
MLRLGIIGCSEIAYRRFMPAVQNVDGIRVIAVAEEYAPAKLASFCADYHLEAETDFKHLIEREDIDALYIPQPPALHYKWAKYALEHGKHVLVEKPSTMCFADTKDLVDTAKKGGLALHENYMFQYHSQIRDIRNLIAEGKIGEVRLYRASFGFPMRAQNDFRYKKNLGGGALLDAGGYTVKLATKFLGETVRVDAARLYSLPGFEVDMMGSASLSNEDGVAFQVGFGMDCHYQCLLEVWGSKGKLTANRIFTAPPALEPVITIETAEGKEEIKLSADSHFEHSIERFAEACGDTKTREQNYREILLQASLIDQIRAKNEE